MSNTFPPSAEIATNAHVDAAKYDKMYAASIADPEAFWREQGHRVDWMKPFTKVKDVNYNFGEVGINWYAGGTLNVSANCIDRHLATRADQTAIIFDKNEPIITNTSTSRFSPGISIGVKAGYNTFPDLDDSKGYFIGATYVGA